MVCIRYRPRQPRASPLWQILHDHAGQLPAVHLHPEAAVAIAAFLRCGDLHAGFTRLHCPDCGHEFLLAFTCKQRGAPSAPPATSGARSSKVPSSPTPCARPCPTATSSSPCRASSARSSSGRFSRSAKTYQTGFELPPAPETPAEARGQGQLFDDDYAQPDAAEGEPVFWTAGTQQPSPDEDFIQADAPESNWALAG